MMALVPFTAEESSKSSLNEEESGWAKLSQPNEESATIGHSHDHGHKPDRVLPSHREHFEDQINPAPKGPTLSPSPASCKQAVSSSQQTRPLSA